MEINEETSIEETYAYKRGYHKAMHDIFMLFLALGNKNLDSIESEVRNTIEQLISRNKK